MPTRPRPSLEKRPARKSLKKKLRKRGKKPKRQRKKQRIPRRINCLKARRRERIRILKKRLIPRYLCETLAGIATRHSSEILWSLLARSSMLSCARHVVISWKKQVLMESPQRSNSPITRELDLCALRRKRMLMHFYSCLRTWRPL